jgi:hypothetical protein
MHTFLQVTKFYHSFHHNPTEIHMAKTIKKKQIYSPKIFIRLEAFTAIEFNKIFSGR